MGKRHFLRTLFIFVVVFFLVTKFSFSITKKEKEQKPNVVLVFIDDGGYADFKPFGEPLYPTPNVNTLAEEGRSFYNFYVPQAVCSASRAALLTGCYPEKTGIFGALGPKKPGLEPQFSTLGEVLQKNGYVTASFGKWHIGDVQGRRPQSRGFDETCGLMYSNDMWPNHPQHPANYPPLPYWENGKITIDTVTYDDQNMLTTWYTEKSVEFINNHKNEPFFLYVPHSMAHVPIACSDKFRGKSGVGLYGDVIMELDWSIGQIMEALRKNGLEENTIFILISSDNGPWLSYSDHAGITPFREGKGTSFEGGVRNPCVIKYPGHIPPKTKSHKTFCSVDILPTICYLTDTQLPDNDIDGKNVWDLIQNKTGAKNPHDYYPFTTGSQFQGLISADGRWKLHLPHTYRTLEKGGKDGQPGKYIQSEIDTALFDLIHDPYEKGNVIEQYPQIADKLIKYTEKHQKLFFND
jgi:arylsulfatase A